MVSSRELLQKTIQEVESIYSTGEAKEITFLLFNHLYSLNKIDVLSDKPIAEEKQKELSSCIERLKKYEPIQYIIGQTEFYGYPFLVNPSVLIPRQETEELIKLIVEENKNKNELRIFDIGTGSGCIPICLKKELPFADVSTADISKRALETASENARLNQVNIIFKEVDILNKDTRIPEVDIIVSNPPYVLEVEKKEMHKNVLDYEPSLALFVTNEDPLVFYRTIITKASDSLVSGGKIYFEINEKFGKETASLLSETQFKNIRIIQDIHGKNRMVVGEK